MEITIREILKQHIPSNEIKQRFNNKQIKLNNISVIDLNQVLNIDSGFSLELGEFIHLQFDRLKDIGYFGNIRDWFGNFDTNVGKYKFLGTYHVLEFSKKDAIVFLIEPSKTYFIDELDAEEDICAMDECIQLPEGLFYYIDEVKFWS